MSHRRTYGTQLLLVSGFLPLSLLFNPIITPLYGKFIPLLLIWRTIWLFMPVLILLALLQKVILRTSIYIVLLFFVGSVILLRPYLQDSWTTLLDYKANSVSKQQIDIMQELEKYNELDDIILTDFDISAYVPGFVTNTRLLIYRWHRIDAQIAGEIFQFYNAQQLDTAQANFLKHRAVSLMIMPTQHPLLDDFISLPDDFSLLYENDQYALVDVHLREEIPPLAQGYTAYLLGDYEGAKQSFEAGEHWLQLSQTLVENGEFEQANSILQKIVDQSDYRVLKTKARILESQNEIALATEIWLDIVNLYPNNPIVLEELGRLLVTTRTN